MAASVVKTVYVSNGSGTSTTAALPSATYASGNALAMLLEYDNASARTISFSDGGSNTWNQPLAQQIISDRFAFAYAQNITGFTGAITATWSATSAFRSMLLFDITGVDTSAYVGAILTTQTTPGGATDALTCSVNPTGAPGIVVAVAINEASPNPPVPGTGFTTQGTYFSFGGESGTGSHNGTGTDGAGAQSKAYSATGSQATTWTAAAGGISDPYVMLSAYFKEPSGGGGSPLILPEGGGGFADMSGGMVCRQRSDMRRLIARRRRVFVPGFAPSREAA